MATKTITIEKADERYFEKFVEYCRAAKVSTAIEVKIGPSFAKVALVRAQSHAELVGRVWEAVGAEYIVIQIDGRPKVDSIRSADEQEAFEQQQEALKAQKRPETV